MSKDKERNYTGGRRWDRNWGDLQVLSLQGTSSFFWVSPKPSGSHFHGICLHFNVLFALHLNFDESPVFAVHIPESSHLIDLTLTTIQPMGERPPCWDISWLTWGTPESPTRWSFQQCCFNKDTVGRAATASRILREKMILTTLGSDLIFWLQSHEMMLHVSIFGSCFCPDRH